MFLSHTLHWTSFLILLVPSLTSYKKKNVKTHMCPLYISIRMVYSKFQKLYFEKTFTVFGFSPCQLCHFFCDLEQAMTSLVVSFFICEMGGISLAFLTPTRDISNSSCRETRLTCCHQRKWVPRAVFSGATSLWPSCLPPLPHLERWR